jgi:flagellar L-ring protein precursor FlgH
MIRTVCALALLAGACSSHIAPYVPKKRNFEMPEYDAPPPQQGASLYAEGGPGLFDDDRARRVGDIVIIRIDESDSATRDDSTSLDRKSTGNSEAGLFSALGKVLPSGVNPTDLFNHETKTEFEGGGTIKRSGRLVATLPVRIRKVLPNGDFFLEGTKVVMIGREEQHLYVSGVVRPTDIRPDGTVASSRIADAEIEFVGRGDVSNQQRQGWFTRVLNKVWPF